ncbi:MAG: ABC transporter permease [Anaerolineaceae bacterium]
MTVANSIPIDDKKIHKHQSKSRRIVMGIIFLLVAAVIWFVFINGTDQSAQTTFNMTPGGSSTVMADWVFSTTKSLSILAVLCAITGAYQLIRGFQNLTNGILGLVAVMFIFSFLTWASSGGSINLAGLLRVTVVRAVPLTLGAMAGILCERSGTVNIAIEGMMLIAAFVSTVIASLTNLWIGMLSGILAGALVAYVHGILTIKYKVDHVISGTVINIFATGITSFLSSKFIQKTQFQYLNEPGMFPQINIPVLSKIPFFGPILFSHNLYVYAMFILVPFLTIELFSTRWGLRLRSAGENPKAADTLGINVIKTRYMGVILGGMMAGFAGTYFTLGSSGRFDELMTAGRGFIALAAMIFGNYYPVGAMGAGLLFGFFDSLAAKASILKVPIPSDFLGMMPYIATIVVLAGVVGRSNAPAAEGKAYEKESL